jgi:hypothetical protein
VEFIDAFNARSLARAALWWGTAGACLALALLFLARKMGLLARKRAFWILLARLYFLFVPLVFFSLFAFWGILWGLGSETRQAARERAPQLGALIADSFRQSRQATLAIAERAPIGPENIENVARIFADTLWSDLEADLPNWPSGPAAFVYYSRGGIKEGLRENFSELLSQGARPGEALSAERLAALLEREVEPRLKEGTLQREIGGEANLFLAKKALAAFLLALLFLAVPALDIAIWRLSRKIRERREKEKEREKAKERGKSKDILEFKLGGGDKRGYH